MISLTQLTRSRGKCPNYNNCPQHIPMAACSALLREAGIEPTDDGAGFLGDVLENFAIAVAKGAGDGCATRSALERSLRSLTT